MARTPNTLDKTLTDKWSPNRDEYMKVTSLQDGNIRGGYWVLNKNGESATIAFCFKNSEGYIFGLTIAHLFESVGDPVFVFLLHNPTPTPVEYARSDAMIEQMDYEMIEIGEVVAMDVKTDSAIFEVTDDCVKGRIDLLRLLPRSGLGDRELVLPRPSLSAVRPISQTKCAVYGAASRGTLCTVSTPYLEPKDARENALAGDVGFEKESGCLEQATQDGDCGALYLDVADGCPQAMHHAMICYRWPGTDKPHEYESFGVSLAPVMATHQEQFDEQMYGSIEAPSDNMDGGEQGSGCDERRKGAVSTKTFQIKTFPVKVVKGDVSELLASREKKGKTNPYEGVNLDRSNAVRTVSGQIYRWTNVRARSTGGSDEADK